MRSIRPSVRVRADQPRLFDDVVLDLVDQRPPIEPGLEPLIAATVAADRLSFSTDIATSAAHADALFIAVGTPSRATDGWPDLSSVYAVARSAAASPTTWTAHRSARGASAVGRAGASGSPARTTSAGACT